MRRGTTVTNTFSGITYGPSDIQAIYITYEQAGKIIVEKSIEEISLADNTAAVTLSQADTLKFSQGPVSIQIRLKTKEGIAAASNIIRTDVSRILKDGEI